ncbi:MAG: hypothetical protein KGI25_02980 [Thaumarchaeota archaeon]|nr:hypothetical protein [Nitrososphaerota archaeon]
MNDQPTAEFKVEKRSVNSRSLCEQIQKDVEGFIGNAGVLWSSDVHREGFLDTIGEYLENLLIAGTIEQWNCLCDLRNNTIHQMDQGVYIFEINYRQKHCLNTTRLIYTVKDLLISSLKELLDFQVTP